MTVVKESKQISFLNNNEGNSFNISNHKATWHLMLIYALLLIIFIASIQYKNYLFSTFENYQRSDSTGAFWTEAAFHFRHARMVKDGLGIPTLDKQVQYPEGIEIWKYCTPIMDWLYGTLYRLGLSPNMPFHQFVIKTQYIWSSLSIFAIFLGGLALWRNHWSSLLGAAFYAFSLGHLDRVSLYLRENFALPLIWLHLALFLMAVRSKRKSKNILLSIGSASLLISAFASWHVSRFYFLIFIIGLAVTQLPLKGKNLIGSVYFYNVRRALLLITAFNIVAALLLPMLKVTNFVTDPSMMLSYGLLVCYYFLPWPARMKEKAYYLLSLVILAIFFFTSYALEKAQGFYSHVEELLKSKIHFLGKLPEDPTLLSFEARVMWNGPFKSPSLEYFLILAIPGIVLLSLIIVMMIRDWHKGKANRLATIIAFLSIFSIFAFILILRLHVLMHIPIAFLATRIGYSKIRKYRIIGIIVLSAFILIQLFLMVSTKITIIQPNAKVLRSLTHFIKKDTPKDAVFACEFNLGPTISCDANRAVLLQSKFENPTIRKKVQEVYEAMFNTEEELLTVCKKYGATYFVLGVDTILNTSQDSMRYINGKKGISQKMISYQMHFNEQQLQHFQLIFQNVNYRIFKISNEPSPPLPPDQYWPIWDEEIMGLSQVQSALIPDTLLEKALYRGTNVFAWLQAAEQLKAAGRIEEAESLVIRAISPAISALEKKLAFRSPDLPSLARVVARGGEEAARVLASRGQKKQAAQLIYQVARPFALMNDHYQSLRLLDKALMYDPENRQIVIKRSQLMKKMQAP